MKPGIPHKSISRSVSFLMGVWLLYASVPHILNPYFFLGTIYSYELLPPGPAVWLAGLLPYFQVVIGICLVANVFRFAAHLIAMILFFMFLVSQTWLRFVVGSSSCGCFGPQNEMLESVSYYLVIAAFLGCSFLVMTMSRQKSLQSLLREGEL